MAKIWAFIQWLIELWNAVKVLLGMIERSAKDKFDKEADELKAIIQNPNSTEEERRAATKRLEDMFNSRT